MGEFLKLRLTKSHFTPQQENCSPTTGNTSYLNTGHQDDQKDDLFFFMVDEGDVSRRKMTLGKFYSESSRMSEVQHFVF